MTRNRPSAWGYLILLLGAGAGCYGQIGDAGLPGAGGSGAGGAGSPPSAGTTGTDPSSGAGGTGPAGSTGPAGGGSAGTSGTVADTGLPCDVATLLSNRCWTCHGPTPAAVGLPSLVTRAQLMAPSGSDPSKTNAQLAVTRMQNTASPMPPPPTTPASAAETATLNNWIAAGYPTGSCGTTSGTGGSSGSGGSSGTGGAGGVSDPFGVPPTCTSMTTWTRGNNGSSSMNPGMACISCHATSGGEAPRYAIAGTVYPTAHEPDLCNGAGSGTGAQAVQVVIVGADGRTTTLMPNSAGNFYAQTTVATPYQAKVVYMGRERAMVAKQTSGDCNSCHTQNGTNSAPGRILLP